MQTNTKAFTLVEMLVAMAVSTIIIAATYASYDLVANQYKKNIDVAEMNTSGRAIMQMIERDVRMAGFEYRDQDAKVTYGSITAPLVIKDSGNKCCDEVTIIYDYYDEDSKKAERIRITYSAKSHSSNKGDRYRLYKQIDVLGKNNAILAKPIIGSKDLLADFLEDLQFVNVVNNTYLFSGADYRDNIEIFDINERARAQPEGWIIGTSKNGAFAAGANGLLYSASSMQDGITIYEPFKNKKGRSGYFGSARTNDVIAVDAQGLVYVGFKRSRDIEIYDPKTGQKVGKIPTSIYISSMDFGPDGKLYASNAYFRQVYVYDTTTKKKIGEIKTGINIYHEISGQHIAFLGNNMWVAAQNHYIIKKFRLSDWKENGSIQTNPICGPIAFGPDGYLYCGGFKARGIRIYNPNTGAKVGSINTQNRVDALAFVSESIGNKWLVKINFTLRSRNPYGNNRQFKKKDYHAGNYNLDKTDKYKRDTFSSTVTARNMAL